MPSFSDLITNADIHGSYRIDGVGEVWLSSGDSQCMMCLDRTPWIETCANGPICSAECSTKFWAELNEACLKSNNDPANNDEDVGF